jgi:hypothetical protein
MFCSDGTREFISCWDEFRVFHTFEKLNMKMALGFSHLSSLRLAVFAVSAQYFTKEKTHQLKI